MPRSRLTFALAVCGAAAALAACSLFTDLSSLEEPPANPDASTSGPDAATTSETGTATDSGGDADSGAIDAGGCGADFCDDFDDAAMVGAGWDGVDLAFGGTLSFETTTVVSPPNALRSVLAYDGGSDFRAAILRKDLPAGGKVACSFSAWLVSGVSDATRELDLVRIEAADPTVQFYRFNLAVRGAFVDYPAFNASVRDDLMLLDGGCACPSTHQYFAGPPVGKWIRVDFVVDFAKGTSLVSFDGSVVFTGANYTKLAATRTTVMLGLGSRTATTSVVLYDDLRCSVD